MLNFTVKGDQFRIPPLKLIMASSSNYICVIFIYMIILFVSSVRSAEPKEEISRQNLLAANTVVERVNSANAGWRAELYPKFARMSEAERSRLNGLAVPDRAGRGKTAPGMSGGAGKTLARVELPEQFDVRERWPKCAEVIGDVRDQSRCGNCWAVAAAGAFSDRLCIKSDGKYRVSVSDIDTASCAILGEDGCQGASDLSPAWKFFHKFGVVTGSNFTLQKGCKPYPFPPTSAANDNYRTPSCTLQCHKNFKDKTYIRDKLYADVPIVLSADDNKVMEQLIMQELHANGSVEVGFIVYSDFFFYKSGVYKHTWGSVAGGHAVRVIGWGVDGEAGAYWLIANSWGADWGERGLFRIRRGTDEAYIETMTEPYAANPIFK